MKHIIRDWISAVFAWAAALIAPAPRLRAYDDSVIPLHAKADAICDACGCLVALYVADSLRPEPGRPRALRLVSHGGGDGCPGGATTCWHREQDGKVTT